MVEKGPSFIPKGLENVNSLIKHLTVVCWRQLLTSQEFCEQLTSCGKLEIDQDRSIYTRENGKHHQSACFFSFFWSTY